MNTKVPHNVHHTMIIVYIDLLLLKHAHKTKNACFTFKEWNAWVLGIQNHFYIMLWKPVWK